MTTIVVTGATGNVGSHVVRELRDRGVAVRAFVRDREKAGRMFGHGVEVAMGDFEDAVAVRTAMTGADAVLLSSANHPRQAEHEIGVVDAAVAAGVRRVVKLSTIGAARGSALAFWDAHGRSEEHLRRSVPRAVILQSNFYMSNFLGAAETARTLGKLFAPADGARIGMIDPRDVAATAVCALTGREYDGQTLVATGPEAITYAQVAEHLSAATGRRIEFIDVPDDAARESMVSGGMPVWVAEHLVVLFGLLRRGAAEETTDAVRKVTGRDPRPFARFARDHAPLFGSASNSPAVTGSPFG